MIEIDPIHKLISIPAIWVPDPDVQMQEIVNMIERSRVAQSFLRGEISFDDYLCFLAEQGFDPLEFYAIWNAGGTFL
ncbi:hypothetical protein [Coleofasciculus chthonoplastes]|uniref:hypothetical protein n=1 Tax=Coleofasciculus chthonoplastes TaxID=64178 RepID=UPI0032F178ED